MTFHEMFVQTANIHVVATVCGISVDSANRFVRLGIFKRSKDGTYHTPACFNALIEYREMLYKARKACPICAN